MLYIFIIFGFLLGSGSSIAIQNLPILKAILIFFFQASLYHSREACFCQFILKEIMSIPTKKSMITPNARLITQVLSFLV